MMVWLLLIVFEYNKQNELTWPQFKNYQTLLQAMFFENYLDMKVYFHFPIYISLQGNPNEEIYFEIHYLIIWPTTNAIEKL